MTHLFKTRPSAPTRRAALALAAGLVALPAAGLAQVSGTWQAADGVWSAPANWATVPATAAFPTGGGAATFNQAFAGTRTITLDTPVSLGRITFDSAGSYRVAPSGSNAITLVEESFNDGRAFLSVPQGEHAIAAPLRTGLRADGSLDELNVVKTGAGRLVLSGDNTGFQGAVTGAFTIEGGSLAARSNGAIGRAQNIVAPLGGTLELGGPAGSGQPGVTVTDQFLILQTAPAAGAIRATSGTNTWRNSSPSGVEGWFLVGPSTVGADAGATLVLDAPIITDGTAATSNLTKVGAGTFTNARRFDLPGTLTVSAGQAGTSPGVGTSRLGGLSIGGTPTAPTGRYDVANNATILPPTDLTIVRQRIRAAYSPGGGAAAWSGNGITTTAGTSNTFGLAYGTPATFRSNFPATFRGQAVSPNETIIAYARFGDADLSGTVNISDFGRLRNNYFQSGRLWFQGDFSYDGLVNIADFGLLRTNYFQTGPAALTAGVAGARLTTAEASDSSPLTLVIDERTGDARIVGSPGAVLTAYEIVSATGGLDPAQWTLGSDAATWFALGGDAGGLAAGDLGGSGITLGDDGLWLGDIVAGGASGLTFQYLDAASILRTGAVSVVPEPGSLVAVALVSVVAGVSRRRRPDGRGRQFSGGHATPTEVM